MTASPGDVSRDVSAAGASRAGWPVAGDASRAGPVAEDASRAGPVAGDASRAAPADPSAGDPRTTAAVADRATDAELHHRLLAQMLRIRRFEERCVQLYSQAKIRGFLHLYIGEEAVATGVMEALSSDDAVVSTYREHGHALARGLSSQSLMAEMYGRVTGCSRGRGGSMHLFDASARFYGGSAIVGGGLPLAVGLALADRFADRRRVTACFFGDGAVAEGTFHECMNLAALWRLPVLFCCENNRYAMGTAIERAQANTDLAGRAASYGMTAEQVDGMDVLAVLAAARAGVAAVRDGFRPHFMELRTYRFRSHSMYDPDRYRDKEEIARWRRRDPIDLLVARMRADGRLTEADLAALESEIGTEIEAAVAAAEAAPEEPVSELMRFVYAEPTAPGVAGRTGANVAAETGANAAETGANAAETGANLAEAGANLAAGGGASGGDARDTGGARGAARR